MGSFQKHLPTISLTGAIQRLRSFVRPGTSITITSNEVVAQMGNQTFILHNQPHELEADLEAFERLTARRVQ